MKSVIKLKKLINLDLIPLLTVVSLLPFLHAGEAAAAQVIFFAFPAVYLPIFLRRQRLVNQTQGRVILVWSLFLLTGLITTVNSTSLALALPVYFRRLGFFLYFLFFAAICETKRDFKIIKYSIMAVGLALALISLGLLIARPFFSLTLPLTNLWQAQYGHNLLIDYLIFAWPLAIVEYWQEKSQKRKRWFKWLVIVLAVAAYFTFARWGLVIITLTAFILVKKYQPMAGEKRLVMILGLIPALFLGLIIIFSQVREIPERLLPRGQDSQWLKKQLVKPIAKEGRWDYWQQAYWGWLDRPWLGSGPGTFRLTSDKFKSGNVSSFYAHNHLLESFSEEGIIGSLPFLLLIGLVFFKLRKTAKNDPEIFPIYLGLGAAFGQSFVNITFELTAIYLTFWVLAAVSSKYAKGGNKQISLTGFNPLILIAAWLCLAFSVTALVGEFYLNQANKNPSGKQQAALDNYRRALYLPAFSNRRFIDYLAYLEEKAAPKTKKIPEKYILAWNKEDPAIIYYLAKLAEYGGNPQALEYYQKLTTIAPANAQYLVAYLGYLWEAGQPTKVNELLFESGLNFFSRLATIEEINGLKQIYKTNEIWLNKEENQTLTQYNSSEINRFYARYYYLLGLKYWESGQTDAATRFWEAALKLAPNWSQFYLELASLYRQSGKANQAEKVQTACRKNEYAQANCERYLKEAEAIGFENPGDLYSEIMRI